VANARKEPKEAKKAEGFEEGGFKTMNDQSASWRITGTFLVLAYKRHFCLLQLIFSLKRYEEVMEAYVSGLEQYEGDLSKVASVASFFISRVENEVRGGAPIRSVKKYYQSLILMEQICGGRSVGGNSQRWLGHTQVMEKILSIFQRFLLLLLYRLEDEECGGSSSDTHPVTE
jgi:hypothetical protein